MEKEQKIITNPFFSRGCCAVPNAEGFQSVYKPSCAKLDAYDWLQNIELITDTKDPEFVEVRFKNCKKEFYKVTNGMNLETGDFVAVESTSGHDIGIVTLTGEIVKLQMDKKNCKLDSDQIKKVYRRVRSSDIEKWVASVQLEEESIFKTRQVAENCNLNMKVNDVEYQGDGTKAIFYYTADERVDFREMIKMLAETFKVRIEMRQIGARQEAARLGGIGTCGRELCCSTWLTGFTSVTTVNARTQQLSLNPSKLAGQCAKLKCCLNYENDMYLEALAEFPDSDIILKTKKGNANYQKADVFKKIIWYSYMDDNASLMAIPLDKAQEIIDLNKQGKLPVALEEFAITLEQKSEDSVNLDNDILNQFDREFN